MLSVLLAEMIMQVPAQPASRRGLYPGQFTYGFVLGPILVLLFVPPARLSAIELDVVSNGHPGRWRVVGMGDGVTGDGTVDVGPGSHEFELRGVAGARASIEVTVEGDVVVAGAGFLRGGARRIEIMTHEVAFDLGGYVGRWNHGADRILPTSTLEGNQTVRLAPGTYSFGLASVDNAYVSYTVATGSGEVTSADPQVAVGGTGTFTLQTFEIRFELGGYQGRWRSGGDSVVASVGQGDGSFVLPPGDFFFGLSGVHNRLFQYTVAPMTGEVTSAAPDVAVGGTRTLTLQTVEVTFDPNGYLSRWRTGADSSADTIFEGLASATLIPATYWFGLAGVNNRLVQYTVAPVTGNVTTSNPGIATGGLRRFTLRTFEIHFDANGYFGLWRTGADGLTHTISSGNTAHVLTPATYWFGLPGVTHQFVQYTVGTDGSVTTGHSEKALGGDRRFELVTQPWVVYQDPGWDCFEDYCLENPTDCIFCIDYRYRSVRSWSWTLANQARTFVGAQTLCLPLAALPLRVITAEGVVEAEVDVSTVFGAADSYWRNTLLPVEWDDRNLYEESVLSRSDFVVFQRAESCESSPPRCYEFEAEIVPEWAHGALTAFGLGAGDSISVRIELPATPTQMFDSAATFCSLWDPTPTVITWGRGEEPTCFYWRARYLSAPANISLDLGDGTRSTTLAGDPLVQAFWWAGVDERDEERAAFHLSSRTFEEHSEGSRIGLFLLVYPANTVDFPDIPDVLSTRSGPGGPRETTPYLFLGFDDVDDGPSSARLLPRAIHPCPTITHSVHIPEILFDARDAETIMIPLVVTSPSVTAAAQLAIQYDSNILAFESVELGRDVPDGADAASAFSIGEGESGLDSGELVVGFDLLGGQLGEGGGAGIDESALVPAGFDLEVLRLEFRVQGEAPSPGSIAAISILDEVGASPIRSNITQVRDGTLDGVLPEVADGFVEFIAPVETAEIEFCEDLDLGEEGVCRSDFLGSITYRRSALRLDEATGRSFQDVEILSLEADARDPICGTGSWRVSIRRTDRVRA